MSGQMIILIMFIMYITIVICCWPGGPIGAISYFKSWIKNKIRGLSFSTKSSDQRKDSS